MRPLGTAFVMAGSILLCGCAEPDAAPEGGDAAADAQATEREPKLPKGYVRDARFVQHIADAVAGFGGYTKIGDWPKWAPTMCSAPPPPGALMSRSTDAEVHGGKLYFLHLNEPVAYVRTPRPEQPVGQVIVKRSYAAEPVDLESSDDGVRGLLRTGGVVRRGEQWFRVGAERELFVMVKLAADTPGTDRGWVYGTATADGSRITSAGRVARCMGCHADAGPDRIFGPTVEGHLKSLGGDARALAADAAAGW